MKAGACRYDTEGVTEHNHTQEEEQYAQARPEKVRRQNRIKDELRAIPQNKQAPCMTEGNSEKNRENRHPEF